jgi:hypothetical protein
MRSLRCSVALVVLVFVSAVVPGALARAMMIEQVQRVDNGIFMDFAHTDGAFLYDFKTFNRVADEGGFQGTLVGVTWDLSVDEVQLRTWTRPPTYSVSSSVYVNLQLSGGVGFGGESHDLFMGRWSVSSPCEPALPCDISVIDYTERNASYTVMDVSPYIDGLWASGWLGADIGYVLAGCCSNSATAHVYGEYTLTYTYEPVPEPSTLLLLCSGLAGLGGMAWRHRRG